MAFIGLLLPLFLGAAVLLGVMSADYYTHYNWQIQQSYNGQTQSYYSERDLVNGIEASLLELKDAEALVASQQFENQTANIYYWGINKTTGKVVTNLLNGKYGKDYSISQFTDEIARQSIFNYFISCSNGTLDFFEDVNGPFDQSTQPVYNLMRSEGRMEYNGLESANYSATSGNYDLEYGICIRKDSNILYTDYTVLRDQLNDTQMMGNIYLTASIGAAILFLLLLVIYIANRRNRLALREAIGQIMVHIPLEIKAIVFLLAAMLTMTMLSRDFIFFAICAYADWYLLYLFFADIAENRAGFILNTIPRRFYLAFCKSEMKYPFQKRISRRHTFYFAAQSVLFAILVLAIWFYSVFCWRSSYALFFLLCFVTTVVYLVINAFIASRMTRSQMMIVADIGRVAAHIRQIREGDLDSKLNMPQSSDLYELAEDLNDIQSGLAAQVEQRLKSERMKVELITNVSHDLKTPLTSMVNYIDLLKKEDLSPDYANDYVRVIDRKTHRLHDMVQDLFDISKANSGSMEVSLERIDLGELIQQTIAEAEDRISRSGLRFKLSRPGRPMYVVADGRKMWRVIDNLLGNALKYALPGTRVYIDVVDEGNMVSLSVKNIANYEMNFSADEIIERFRRGDESRTTEGSGLGLSIVESFVQIQHGTFDIVVDGDLFKTVVRLPKYRESSEPSDASAQSVPLPQDGGDTQFTVTSSFGAEEIAEILSDETSQAKTDQAAVAEESQPIKADASQQRPDPSLLDALTSSNISDSVVPSSQTEENTNVSDGENGQTIPPKPTPAPVSEWFINPYTQKPMQGPRRNIDPPGKTDQNDQ